MSLPGAARRLGQAMIGSTFVALGYAALTAPGGRVGLAADTLAKIRRVVPLLPADDEVLVRTNAAAQTVCGAMLVAGVLPRVAATVIAGSLVPTTMAGHPFWAAADEHERKAQKVQFHKNVALFGALLLIAVRRR